MSLELSIEGIPGIIVNEHQEALYHWNHLGLRDTSLVHIDAHDDLGAPAPKPSGEINKDYVSRLNQGNFLCPAAHRRIFNELYWINPFSIRTVGYVGVRDFSGKKENIIL